MRTGSGRTLELVMTAWTASAALQHAMETARKALLQLRLSLRSLARPAAQSVGGSAGQAVADVVIAVGG